MILKNLLELFESKNKTIKSLAKKNSAIHKAIALYQGDWAKINDDVIESEAARLGISEEEVERSVPPTYHSIYDSFQCLRRCSAEIYNQRITQGNEDKKSEESYQNAKPSSTDESTTPSTQSG